MRPPKLISGPARTTAVWLTPIVAVRGLFTGARLGQTAAARDGRPPVSPHLGFHRSFGRPLSKVFLVAMGTYQALYWCWLKLAVIEEQQGRIDEIKTLEGQLDAARVRRERERAGVGGTSGV